MNIVFKKQKGVALIMSFFIMVIILAVVFSISGLLYSEIRIIRNMGNSTIAIFAADSGIEKVLYYDNKVFPNLPDDAEGNPVTAVRGLCTMYQANALTNPLACVPYTSDGSDNSIFCNSPTTPQIKDGDLENHADGCDSTKCDDCKISFDSDFDDRQYHVDASIRPTLDGENSIFEIDSLGTYGNTARKFKVFLTIEQGQGAIVVDGNCINPRSTEQGGTIIDVYAHIKSVNNVPIDSANSFAKIYRSSDRVNQYDSVPLACYKTNQYDSIENNTCVNALELADGYWKGSWTTDNLDPVDSYFVNLDIKDTMGPPGPNQKIVKDIPYCVW